jgi:hypothetical protein
MLMCKSWQHIMSQCFMTRSDAREPTSCNFNVHAGTDILDLAGFDGGNYAFGGSIFFTAGAFACVKCHWLLRRCWIAPRCEVHNDCVMNNLKLACSPAMPSIACQVATGDFKATGSWICDCRGPRLRHAILPAGRRLSRGVILVRPLCLSERRCPVSLRFRCAEAGGQGSAQPSLGAPTQA